MKRLIFAACIAASFLVADAQAQTATPRVTRRQVRQERRIDQGVRSGTLTPREAGRLETREARLQQNKEAAKSDGVVTAGERRHLRREENRSSRAIYRQKHDAQVR